MMKEKKEKIYTCSKCKGQVEKNAKECPHCGRKNPTVGLGVTILAWVILISVLFAIFSPSDEEKESSATQSEQVISEIDQYMDTLLYSDQVKPAVLVNLSDTSFSGRTRLSAMLFSTEATTDKELLATAISAARQIQREKKVQFVSVIMHSSEKSALNQDTPILVLDYAADRKGVSGEKDEGSRYKLDMYFGEDPEIASLKK